MDAKTVLVTGAHGFIGRYVARHYFSQKWKVVGIGHGQWSKNEWEEWGLERWHESDVTISSLAALNDTPDVIVHCAGSGSVGFSLEYPVEDFMRTVLTTQAVLEYIRGYSPASKMILPSSAAVYGASVQLPISETSSLNPISPYGVHKKISEEICEMYVAQYGVSVAIIRLFSVYGAGLHKQLLWDACRKLENGNNSFYGTGEETRDWVHVEDIASLLYLAHNRADNSCPIVNGASGVDVSTREVLALLFKYYGMQEAPSFIGNRPNGDPQHYKADISLAERWGWKTKVSLDQGIKNYVDWYKQVEK